MGNKVKGTLPSVSLFFSLSRQLALDNSDWEYVNDVPKLIEPKYQPST